MGERSGSGGGNNAVDAGEEIQRGAAGSELPKGNRSGEAAATAAWMRIMDPKERGGALEVHEEKEEKHGKERIAMMMLHDQHSRQTPTKSP